MNRDFAEMLSALSAEGAEYLVVGAHAMASHGYPRATGDLDLWVRPTAENAKRVYAALRKFGAPLRELAPSDLSAEGLVFQIGVVPCRIDVLTSIDGVEFERAWAGRIEVTVGETRVGVLGFADLLTNKRASRRPKDLADLAWLESRVDE